eukprot:3168071-Pleurochrysis_carterae.AAC.3
MATACVRQVSGADVRMGEHKDFSGDEMHSAWHVSDGGELDSKRSHRGQNTASAIQHPTQAASVQAGVAHGKCVGKRVLGPRCCLARDCWLPRRALPPVPPPPDGVRAPLELLDGLEKDGALGDWLLGTPYGTRRP